MNRKGIFFTSLVLAMISLFVISYTVISHIDERRAIEKRVQTLNSYVKSIEDDIPRQLFISGYRAIFLMEKRTIETGNYTTSVSSAFQEIFFNGTLYNQTQNLTQGVKFSDIQTNLQAKADKINAEVFLTSPVVSISQEDPWNIKITLTTNLYVRDKNDLATWNKTSTLSTKIPIKNFDDPLYFISTNGKITNKINQTSYTTFAQGSDVSNLNNHLINSYYKDSTAAPSFINRLQGSLSASPYGIESLVNLQELSAAGITIQEKSAVDYIYFSVSNPSSHHIQGMPGWFKLDDSHLSAYQVSSLTID